MQLYKYCSLNPCDDRREHTLDILKNNRLYMASPSQLNDPFDCHLPLDLNDTDIKKFMSSQFNKAILEGDKEALDKYIEVRHSQEEVFAPRNREELEREIYNAFFADFGICSFCGPERDKHKENLMWAHYADNHKGICLIFIDERPLGTYKQLVQYVPTPPKIKILDAAPQEIVKAVTTKADYWVYENEYRLVVPEMAKKFLPFQTPSLVGVEFGWKCSDDDIKEVIGILHEKRYPGLDHSKRVLKSLETFTLGESDTTEINYYKEFYAERRDT